MSWGSCGLIEMLWAHNSIGHPGQATHCFYPMYPNDIGSPVDTNGDGGCRTFEAIIRG
jgi:hypothetical protein